MQVITTKSAILQVAGDLKKEGKTIGLVPTMGALHAGHASLVRRAVDENEVCFVSVFVNPTQFNNKEDLAKYPRTLERDTELLASLGAGYVFAPSPEEMYSSEEMNSTFEFDFGGLDKMMEGRMRPGHFNGVVQVVSRLFYLVQPDCAYFGEKDFQQLAIIHYMVERSALKDTFGGLRIIDCPIVREHSGLALSSRNERLSAQGRQIATNISRILFESRECVRQTGTAGCSGVEAVQAEQLRVADAVNAISGLETEYYEIVDSDTLLPASSFNNATGCITVWCEGVRLIDNIRY